MKTVKVLSQRALKGAYRLLWIEDQGLQGPPQPGQFVMLRAWSELDPLLARPFSIHDVKKGAFAVLYQIRGRGTRLLAELNKGDQLAVLGPLGQGFPLPDTQEVWLVAGGIGIAPFLYTAKWLCQKGFDLHLFYGARSKTDLLRVKAFRELGIPVTLATEDGSCGHQGLVTAPLEKALAQKAQVTLLACGPMPMLKAVALLSQKYGCQAYVSLEARMACGLGLCLGCALKAQKGFIHVCREGPVVPAQALIPGKPA